MHSVHLKTSGFLQVLRTWKQIVRSNTRCIHSLLSPRRCQRAGTYRLSVAGLGHTPEILTPIPSLTFWEWDEPAFELWPGNQAGK